MFDPKIWALVPFQFWTLCFFVFGCVAGSFLNVCIHRMPREESIVSPPSHCPHCGYSIPWYLNIPLVTWCWLRGKCANCQAPISARYFLVELLTGLIFAGCWIRFGHSYALVAVVYCVMIGGLIAATFIDFEHFIIPDEITFGGMAAGFLASFLVPASHLSLPYFRPMGASGTAMVDSMIGMAVGGALVYGMLRLGKLLFGRQRILLPPATRIFFTETAVKLPDQEFAYEELFYRSSDVIRLQARHLELIDRCYFDVAVSLKPARLQIGEDSFEPEKVLHMEAVTDQVVLPREAMGLGDVKFMAAIGAFLGWPGVVFSLAVSAIIGSIYGISMIAINRQSWSSRMPYGPYIAVAAVIWIFDGQGCVQTFYRVFDALHGHLLR
jgi:leader peptidase (prepilin peptidase) / N-methyltransferase